MNITRLRVMFLFGISLAACVPIVTYGQEPPPPTAQELKLVARVPDGVVFFFEDGRDPDTGELLPPPSRPLGPITTQQNFLFETGRIVIPGKTAKEFLQIDVYLRQRYSYRNDGQNAFNVRTNPFVRIESAALPQPLRFSVLGNGLHLAASKSLSLGESGLDSRGNFGRTFITAASLDASFGAGTARNFFDGDITVIMEVDNAVLGVTHYVAGTFTQIYGK